MILTINRDALASLVAAPCRIASKSRVAYLACAMLTASDGMLAAEATDLVESVRCDAPALVEGEGRALASARMLSEAARSLPDGAVRVELTPDGVRLGCGKASFTVPVLAPEDFPRIAAPDGGRALTLPAAQAEALARLAATFSAKDPKIPVLSCAHVVCDGGRVTVEATDSYRAVRAWADCGCDELDETIPAAFLLEAVKGAAGDVSVTFPGGTAGVKADSRTSSVRQVEGRFPELSRLFPDSAACDAEFDRAALSGAFRRAVSLGGSAPTSVVLGPSGADVSRKGPDGLGSFSEAVPASRIEGEASLALDARMAAESLSALPGQTVRVRAAGGLSPVRLTCDGADAIVMPMRPE